MLPLLLLLTACAPPPLGPSNGNLTTMAVMSSRVSPSSSFHLRADLVTISCAAREACSRHTPPPPCAPTSSMSFATLSDPSTDHTPSEAPMRTSSLDRRVCSLITGSAVTPTLLNEWSPRLLAIANPAPSIEGSSHTRISERSSSFPTNPPTLSILSLSEGSSGVWSFDRSLCSSGFPDSLRLPSTHRLSPQFAIVHLIPCTRRQLAVVPPASAQAGCLRASNSSACKNARLSTPPGSESSSDACSETNSTTLRMQK
mmetsp:Transcript_7138/g.13277  ORF Transcript_7138/g.13277 Transcript_7138/m.13277 type:complete len:257 (+) Transcript_7138:588-1358(+)